MQLLFVYDLFLNYFGDCVFMLDQIKLQIKQQWESGELVDSIYQYDGSFSTVFLHVFKVDYFNPMSGEFVEDYYGAFVECHLDDLDGVTFEEIEDDVRRLKKVMIESWEYDDE